MSQSAPLTLRCPTCDRKFSPKGDERHLPFCTDRCRLIDLGRWMEEGMSLPVIPDPDEFDAMIPEDPYERDSNEDSSESDHNR